MFDLWNSSHLFRFASFLFGIGAFLLALAVIPWAALAVILLCILCLFFAGLWILTGDW